MASIMIIAGLFTIREWKVHDKNTTTATCLAVVAPCPCSFGAIIASVLIVAPTVGFSFMGLSKYVAAALLVVMIVTYFVSNTIIKFIDKPYPIVLILILVALVALVIVGVVLYKRSDNLLK